MSSYNTTSDNALAGPRLVIVVPIFRHSVLVVDAIEAALAQQAEFAIHIVLVNDGCTHVETHQVCHDYSLSYPDQITYLRKPNGGLSDARNHGIRYALDTLPNVDAIYLLDADNRLLPKAMANAMAELDENPEADWIYPNIDMFGLEFHGDYGGDYSVLTHVGMNVSEAGSLVRRRVFETLLFDTEFKSGWEDWDFFLSAAQHGFRGRNLENFGFRYRKRPESMLAESARDTANLETAFAKKHSVLFKPSSLLEFEQREAPRYALVLADTDEVVFTSDPELETERMSISEFTRRFWRAQTAPSRYHFPGYMIVLTSGVLRALKAAKMLHWAFWRLETLADRNQIATLDILPSLEERCLVNTSHRPKSGLGYQAQAVMIGPEHLSRVIGLDRFGEAQKAGTKIARKPGVAATEITIVESIVPDLGLFKVQMLDTVEVIKNSQWSQAAEYQSDWRRPDIHTRIRAHLTLRRHVGNAPVYPRLSSTGRNIGFVLPLLEFGGVEKVALNMAHALKQQGFVPHLFIFDASDGAVDPQWREVFETVNFFSDPEYSSWKPGTQQYMGTDVPFWAQRGNHSRAVGMMNWLDAVVALNGAAFLGVLGQLKRYGVTTVSSLHLSDLSAHKRTFGNTYLSLAYEHAIDIFAPCSHALADWCHAMGVPQEKIVVVPNAASFPVSDNALNARHAAKAERDTQAPLRVVFLGRLDEQKGLGRLAETVRATHEDHIEWRLIGKAVLESNEELPKDIVSLLEPPVWTPKELFEIYDWADVMVLLSSFEGLPLTILEAMRQGTVVVATDVGAVSEVVQDGENGILLPLNDAVSSCVKALRRLSRDRALLKTLSVRSFQDMARRDWINSTRQLSQRLDRNHD